MKPSLQKSTRYAKLLVKEISGEGIDQLSLSHAQKATECPIVVEFLVDFIHFRPQLSGSGFAFCTHSPAFRVELLEFRAER